MIDSLFSLFRRRPLNKIVEDELDKAMRFLIESEHNRAYFTKQCEFFEMRIAELSEYLAKDAKR